ncbi:MAG: hypothetical protein SVM79_09250, partial [Chloroflexota bacterium]|nr:hypothetical protein [Chloroflexota bacterium]
CSIVCKRLSSMITRMVPIILALDFDQVNESPKTFKAHSVSKIDPSFRLILYWKRLNLSDR